MVVAVESDGRIHHLLGEDLNAVAIAWLRGQPR